MAKWNLGPDTPPDLFAGTSYDQDMFDTSESISKVDMRREVHARLEGLLAEKLVDKMLERFAARAKVSPEIMMELITYMVNDDEFMKRFIADRAAKRIICGPLMGEDMKR